MLAPGHRIGPFEVLAPLGAGGMGEVYRARDTALGREVALKTLPDKVAREPERIARLRREARILASLNHPGIATLHGLEESADGVPVLVMELVPGETLADRLGRGPLPLKEVLRIGQQVAEALAAAHDKAVLHRDLKPDNICLTAEGRAKLLDFGLARALGVDEPKLDPQHSTTTAASHAGQVLGTASYMSPEQARGEELDRRSDVWAFGCVLYELLSGRRAFPGASFPEAAAAVLERDPDWRAVPEDTPDALLRLLRRCLKKDRDERLHDVGDAGLELKELLELSSGGALGGQRPRQQPASNRRAAVALIVGLGAVGGLLVYRSRTTLPSTLIRQSRFQIALPRGVVIPDPSNSAPSYLAVSADGERVAFVGCKESVCLLYLRDRRDLDARPLPDTEGAICPFFSPDGRFIGFGANDRLKRVGLDGGAVVVLADAPQLRGGSWGEDGTILFARGGKGLVRVDADGGEVRTVTQPAAAREYDHRWPHFLPGGRAALFNVGHIDGRYDVVVVDLATGEVRNLVEDAGSPRYVKSGHLMFGRAGTVFAAPFDLDRLVLTGRPLPVLEGVAMWSHPAGGGSISGVVYYDLAREGTLVFSPLEARLPKRTLVWVDRRGAMTPASMSQRAFGGAGLSPDGQRVAVEVKWEVGSSDVFVLDLQRGAWTRVTSDGRTSVVAWLPDGERLLTTSPTEGGVKLLLTRIDGSTPPEMLLEHSEGPFAVAPDGRSLLFCSEPAPSKKDIWRLPLQGDRVAQPWLATPNMEGYPSFSPDGRFVAYFADDSGRNEVYVRPYSEGPRQQVSVQGGVLPGWSRDGREIFFQNRGSLWTAAVASSPTFASEAPRELFKLPDELLFGGLALYDVAPDGQKFLMVQKDSFELRPIELVLVPNWVGELGARMRSAR
jgi:serine/threonine-protein kinase